MRPRSIHASLVRPLLLLLMGCPGDEVDLPSCELELSLAAPAVPSCDDIEARILEVDVVDWREHFDSTPADSFFVSQGGCEYPGSGSLDDPFCGADQAINAAAELDHATIYLAPGEYSAMEEVACGEREQHELSLRVIGAGASSTRLHMTCTPAAGSWAFEDLMLAADTLVVEHGSSLALTRVLESDLDGGTYLDVQGELTVQDLMANLGHPAAEIDPEVGLEDAILVPPITGRAGEASAGLRFAEGGLGWVSGLCLREAAGAGILVTGQGTALTLQASLLGEIRSTGGAVDGYGIAVEHGASLLGSVLLIEDSTAVGVLAHEGASVSLSETTITDTASSVSLNLGVGVLAQLGANASVSASSLSSNQGPGAAATAGGVMSISDTILTENTFAGAIALSGSLTLEGSYVAGTLPGNSAGASLGVFGHELLEDEALTLDVQGNHLEDAPVHLYLRGGSGTEAVIEGNRIGSSTMDLVSSPGVFLMGTSGSTTLGENCLDGPHQLLIEQGSAGLGGNQYLPVAGGETIRQQRCGGQQTVDTSQEILPDPDGLVICPGTPATLGPVVDFTFGLVEVEPVE